MKDEKILEELERIRHLTDQKEQESALDKLFKKVSYTENERVIKAYYKALEHPEFKDDIKLDKES